ncbi:hypothetical protein HS041_36070 [Planomonospora sp. ID67723]|nr:hypothetical protein [Planomonospora sp. ID67723]
MDSWQPHVAQLVASGYIAKAAICGHDGTVWATSPGLSVSPEETRAIISGFKDPNLITDGIRVGGTKYFVV